MTIKFTTSHEWLNAADTAAAVVGISEFAQQQLGEVVFVELPEVGRVFAQGDAACVVESVKAAGDVYAPLSGEVIEVNEALRDDPSLVNSDPLGEGWLFKMKLSDPSQFDALMDATTYDALLQG